MNDNLSSQDYINTEFTKNISNEDYESLIIRLKSIKEMISSIENKFFVDQI